MPERLVKIKPPGPSRAKPKRGPRPGKPYGNFPLYPHAAGVWAKTIRGATYYFGPWNDPEGALKRYLVERDYLYAGQAPPQDEGLTLDELVNRWLAAQRQRQAGGEIGKRQFDDCLRYGKLLLDLMGRARPVKTLNPATFGELRLKLSEGRSATTLAGAIIRIRAVFNWGFKNKLLSAPVEMGDAFRLPPARLRRRALRAGGAKDLTREELLAVLAAAANAPRGSLVNLRCMVLLGVNCGLGNTDCAELRTGHLDFDKRILDFPRPKTEAPRRSALWPETIEALLAVAAYRDRLKFIPAALADRVFVTRRRVPYIHVSPKSGGFLDAISQEFAKLLRATGVHRRGLGFYALRRTFRTVADETRDWPAIDLAMGHAADADDMAARYRQRIGDDRLAAVARHVETWLFGPGDGQEGRTEGATDDGTG